MHFTFGEYKASTLAVAFKLAPSLATSLETTSLPDYSICREAVVDMHVDVSSARWGND
jgi:hypothetical protein